MGMENQDFEIERGPSWDPCANWPLRRGAVTDDLTSKALDPTQMAVEIKAAAKAAGKPEWHATADAVSAASDGDPRDDAGAHLSRARASGRQSRSAGAVEAGNPCRPDARISWLRRRRP